MRGPLNHKQFQCQAEHRMGELICYCQLPMSHGGVHIDYRGRTWTKMFPWYPWGLNRIKEKETK